jgi:phosphate butyryltransferase
MEFKDFSQILDLARQKKAMTPMAVAAAEEDHTLSAAVAAWKEKVVQPWFVGDKAKILALLKEVGETFDEKYIIDSPDRDQAAFEAVKLVREGKASFLMKGILETSQIVKAILNKETGLATGRTLSHMSITHVPKYHKLLVITDAAIIIEPTLAQKKDIIQNAVIGLRALGYEKPKVAVLTSVEKVNPKMPESVDAAELKKMWQEGQITDCDLEGPISLDLALNKEAAEIKGYKSEVTGNPDILLMPNLVCGNILSKSLREFADTTTVGSVMGAKVPMVLTSRGASVRSKYTSIVVLSQMVK